MGTGAKPKNVVSTTHERGKVASMDCNKKQRLLGRRRAEDYGLGKVAAAMCCALFRERKSLPWLSGWMAIWIRVWRSQVSGTIPFSLTVPMRR